MAVEQANNIAELVTTNPTPLEPVHEGPNHIWLIKSVLKRVFPGLNQKGFEKPIVASEDDLNALKDISSLTGGSHADIKSMLTWVDAQLIQMRKEMDEDKTRLYKLYPVGSIYISSSDVNPSDPAVLGFGSWESYAVGMTMFGYDPNSSYEPLRRPGAGGGYANATLPWHDHSGVTQDATLGAGHADGAHNHTVARPGGNTTVTGSATGPVVSGARADVQIGAGLHQHHVYVHHNGTDATNMNYPPLVTVFIWRRTH